MMITPPIYSTSLSPTPLASDPACDMPLGTEDALQKQFEEYDREQKRLWHLGRGGLLESGSGPRFVGGGCYTTLCGRLPLDELPRR